MDNKLRRAVAEARGSGDLYFASLLPEDRITEAFGKARWFWGRTKGTGPGQVHISKESEQISAEADDETSD